VRELIARDMGVPADLAAEIEEDATEEEEDAA